MIKIVFKYVKDLELYVTHSAKQILTSIVQAYY